MQITVIFFLIFLYCASGCGSKSTVQSSKQQQTTGTTANTGGNPNQPQQDGKPPAPMVQAVASPLVLKGCSFKDYSVPIQFNDKTLYLILDTGSSSVAAASSYCGADSGCNLVMPKYTPNSTAKDLNRSISSFYGDSAHRSYWLGRIMEDTLKFGNDAVVKMKFGAIEKSSVVTATTKNFFSTGNCFVDQLGDEKTYLYQGILGVGGPALNASHNFEVDAFVESLSMQDSNYGLFSTLLCDLNGLYWYKGADANYFAAEPIYIPMNTRGYFTINIQAMRLEGESKPFLENLPSAIVDNGTSATFMPSNYFKALLPQLNKNPNVIKVFGANFFSPAKFEDANASFCIEASKIKNMDRQMIDNILPKMIVSIQDVNQKMQDITLKATSSYLVAMPISTSPDTSYYYCFMIIDSGRESKEFPSFIMGNNMMNDAIFIYDTLKNRLGYAPSGKCKQLK